MFCPAIKMPDYFTRLLRGNMQPAGDLFRFLGVYFQDCSSLNALTLYSFADIDPQARIDFFIKNLGWHGLRNRLTSLFLHYAEFGYFPTTTFPERVEPLVKLEELYKNSCVANFSRVFLLAFYLELIPYDENHPKDHAVAIPNLKVVEELFPLFSRFSKSKVVKLDIIILIVLHLISFLGREEVEKALAKGLSYHDILKKITPVQNELLVANMLNYGASVGEEEIFCSRMV